MIFAPDVVLCFDFDVSNVPLRPTDSEATDESFKSKKCGQI